MVEPEKTDSRWLDKGNEPLERELDAALARYAAVEPRAGLEKRVLVNLRAERTKAPDRNWWRWCVAVGLAAAVVVVAIALTWKSVHRTGLVIANHPSTTTPVTQEAVTQIRPQIGNPARPQVHRPTPSASGQHFHPFVVAAVPKLDQFPSPQPLSEQEKLLWNYVAQHPERAGQLAEARMESLRRDAEERQLAAEQPDSQQ